MKSIQYIILAAVAVAFNWFTLSGLGAAPVAEYRAETIGQFFTGSVLDWAGFAGFNGLLLAYVITLVKGKSVDFNEVGSSGKNLIYAGLLLLSVLLVYFG